MALRHGEAGGGQLLCQRVSHRYTAVMAACAAHGDHQHRLSLGVILGQQEQQQLPAAP